MSLPNLTFESSLWDQGFIHVAGVDEVGRGSFAGPVVAAAVIFSPQTIPIKKVNDSKKLSLHQREILFPQIIKQASSWAVQLAPVSHINQNGILASTLLAMKGAILQLSKTQYVLIDGTQKPHIDLPTKTIVQGDQKSYSIAAASILAKVYRDRLMAKLHLQYPSYDWLHNQGYGTLKHRLSIKQYGPSPHHRTQFIRSYL